MIDERLEKIKTLNPTQLEDKAIFQEIFDLAEEYGTYTMIGEAKNLRMTLEKLLQKSSQTFKQSSMYKKYEEVITKLGWYSGGIISDDGLEDLLKNNLLLGFKLGIDVKEFVAAYLRIVFGNITLLNQRRNIILKSLQANQEKIGTQEIVIEGVPGVHSPTVQSWLRDYDQSSVMAKRGSALGVLEYLNKTGNANLLTKKDKQNLITILELYDDLRFLANADSSSLPTGQSKLPTGKLGIPQDDFLVVPSTKPLVPVINNIGITSEEQEILRAYKGDETLNKQVIKELDKLNSKFKDNITAWRAEFFVAVQRKDVAQTIAILNSLAQKNSLESFLKEDRKLNLFLASVWIKQYGGEMAKEFDQQPDQLKFVKLFLRYIFEQRLGVPSSEAARLGLQISNIFVSQGKKSYNKVAYFDTQTKTFRWFD